VKLKHSKGKGQSKAMPTRLHRQARTSISKSTARRNGFGLERAARRRPEHHKVHEFHERKASKGEKTKNDQEKHEVTAEGVGGKHRSSGTRLFCLLDDRKERKERKEKRTKSQDRQGKSEDVETGNQAGAGSRTITGHMSLFSAEGQRDRSYGDKECCPPVNSGRRNRPWGGRMRYPV